MELNEIEEGHVYFDYSPNYPLLVLEIKNKEVMCVDVSYMHHFHICPLATKHSIPLIVFADRMQVRLTVERIAKKAIG